MLPVQLQAGEWAEFRVHIGPRPNFGQALVVLGVVAEKPLSAGGPEVRCNTHACAFAGVHTTGDPAALGTPYEFAVPGAALQQGYNVIEVGASVQARIEWVELSARG